jgi:putative ABC transport system permease protein
MRTLAEPWMTPGLVIGTVGAFIIIVGLISSGVMYADAAVNKVALSGLDEVSPSDAGIDLRILGVPDAAAVSEFDAVMRSRLAASPLLAPPVLTIYATSDRTAAIVGENADTRRVRMMAREGALDAIEVVDSVPGDGVWISESYASVLGAKAGDTISIIHPTVPIETTIAGIYGNIFPIEPGTYWSGLPADLTPLYFPQSGRPSEEIVIVPLEFMFDHGPAEIMRWQAPLASTPSTLEELRTVERFVAGFDTALIQEESEALRSATGRPDPTIVSATRISDVRTGVERAAARLSEPLQTVRLAGLALGLAVAAAAALFAADHNRSVFRLLLSDGDSPVFIGARTAFQLAIPAVLGGGLGLAFGWMLVAALGPDGAFDVPGLDPVEAVMTIALGLALIGVITGAVAVDRAFPKPAQRRPPAADLAILAVAALAWYRVTTAPITSGSRIDLLVVVFPIAGLAASVVVALRLLDWFSRRFQGAGSGLPTPAFMAWRRLASSEATSRTLTGAVALALGVLVFATALVPALDRSLETKAVAVVGGTASADILGSSFPNGTDPDTTTVWHRTARIRSEGEGARLIGIDETTFFGGVTWLDDFAMSEDELIERLNRPVEDPAIPVLAVGSVPSDGVVSSQAGSLSYQVVGRLESFPWVSSDSPTLVFSADRFRTQARAAWESEIRAKFGDTVDLSEFERSWEDPLEGFNETVITQKSPDELRSLLVTNGVSDRNLVTLASVTESPEGQAGILAFSYFQILAGAGLLAAFSSLLISLSQQQRSRRLSFTMASRMGLSNGQHIMATILELAGLVGIASTTAYLSAVSLTRRILPQFDPLPEVPPGVKLDDTAALGLMLTGLTTLIIVSGALWTHRSVRSADSAEVLRGIA